METVSLNSSFLPLGILQWDFTVSFLNSALHTSMSCIGTSGTKEKPWFYRWMSKLFSLCAIWRWHGTRGDLFAYYLAPVHNIYLVQIYEKIYTTRPHSPVATQISLSLHHTKFSLKFLQQLSCKPDILFRSRLKTAKFRSWSISSPKWEIYDSTLGFVQTKWSRWRKRYR